MIFNFLNSLLVMNITSQKSYEEKKVILYSVVKPKILFLKSKKQDKINLDVLILVLRIKHLVRNKAISSWATENSSGVFQRLLQVNSEPRLKFVSENLTEWIFLILKVILIFLNSFSRYSQRL